MKRRQPPNCANRYPRRRAGKRHLGVAEGVHARHGGAALDDAETATPGGGEDEAPQTEAPMSDENPDPARARLLALWDEVFRLNIKRINRTARAPRNADEKNIQTFECPRCAARVLLPIRPWEPVDVDCKEDGHHWQTKDGWSGVQYSRGSRRMSTIIGPTITEEDLLERRDELLEELKADAWRGDDDDD